MLLNTEKTVCVYTRYPVIVVYANYVFKMMSPNISGSVKATQSSGSGTECFHAQEDQDREQEVGYTHQAGGEGGVRLPQVQRTHSDQVRDLG